MNGQWIGSYKGTNEGAIVLEMDDEGTHFAGYAIAYDKNPQLPSTFARVVTKDRSTEFSARLTLAPIDNLTNEVTTWDAIKSRFPEGVVIAAYADSEWGVEAKRIRIKWKTDIGTNGEAELHRSEVSSPSRYEASKSVTN